MDYYMNTIVDMQNEKYFFYRCRKFVYNHDFDIDYNISSFIKDIHIIKNIIITFECLFNSLRVEKLFLRSFTSNNWSIK